MRFAKMIKVAQRKPRAILLGSSLVFAGQRPAHLASILAVPERAVFNLGVPGASIVDIVRFGRHAMAAGGVETIVVGLDYFAFNAHSRDLFDYRMLMTQGDP
ncbi:MAG: hypothetical protein EXQ94_07165 [Alphaproteobacteria bacterium]|nr:hypothetical protein [Alphaproteobacteria bacterium]